MSSIQAATRFTSKNGDVIWLMKNRANERHRQWRRMLPVHATCWDYAPLLDVAGPAPDGKGYRFLNKNVMEWLASLRNDPEEHQRAKEWYQALGARICEIMASHPRTPARYYAFEVVKIPWRSALKDTIRELGLKRAGADQWIGSITALSKKGIKPEEIEQSALIPQLKKKGNIQASITQADVLGMINFNHVRARLVSESTFEFNTLGGWMECCRRISEKEAKKKGYIGAQNGASYLVRHQHRTFGWKIMRVRYSDMFIPRNEWWSVLDEKGKIASSNHIFFDSHVKALSFAEYLMAKRYAIFGRSKTRNRWENYSLPGDDSYQELLLQLEDWPADYFPLHFETRNVLVHIRTSVRTLLDGRRILYLDEVQSDWHAEMAMAKKESVEAAIPDAPFRKEWPLLALKAMLFWAQRQKLDGLAISSQEAQEQRWHGGSPGILYRKTLPEAAHRLLAALGLQSGRVDIPACRKGWKIEERNKTWVVCNEQGVPYTKPFQSYAQAMKFSLLTKGRRLVSADAIWLGDLPQITGVPLYGVGTRASWTQLNRASA